MTYYATTEGFIYNIHDRQIKPWTNPSGYYYVKLYEGKGKYKVISVHRFVYEYFNGEIGENLVIDHINEIKTDNRIENLRATTNAFNCRRRNYNRLNLTLAKEIRRKYAETKTTMDKLAEEYNVGKTTIFNCIKKITWYKK